jgi:hypothetical protein
MRPGGARGLLRHLVRGAAVSLLSSVLLAGSWAGENTARSSTGAAPLPPALVVRTIPPADLPPPGDAGTTPSGPSLPHGWRYIPGKQYLLALPDDWLAVGREAVGATPARAQLEAEHPADSALIAALAVRVADEKLALVAVETPWRAEVMTVTVTVVAKQLHVEDVIAAVQAAGMDSARPVLVQHGFGFMFDTRPSDRPDGRIVTTCLLPIGNGKHLVVAVTGDAPDLATVQEIAGVIATTLSVP